MSKSVIIVAGGSGKRMGTETPKQFLPLNGIPVLMHTIRRFYDAGIQNNIVVVLPAHTFDSWKFLIDKHSFKISHTMIVGGISRFYSVKNGLSSLNVSGIVAIHDGVRPIITSDLINRCFESAKINSNAIPAISVNESVRLVNDDSNSTLDRSKIRVIQTPQCFDISLLKKAYESDENNYLTDDAGVFEKAGNKINLVEGESSNIKITLPSDMIIASALEKQISKNN